MKIAAYVRVSTNGQAENGTGLAVQEAEIKRWAKAHGHRIVSVFSDEGLSGRTELHDRPSLAAAFEALRRGEVMAIATYRVDRLARDLVVQETLLNEARRLGGEIFSTSEAENDFLRDDESDPSRAMIRQILGAVAQYERSMIALRLRAARDRKQASGGYAGFGAPPFGMVSNDGELVPSSGEVETVARIVELRDNGGSLRDICSTLEREGHLTKRGSTRWHPTVVQRILARAA